MQNIKLKNDQTTLAQAYFVGQRLNLRDFEKTNSLAVSPLVITAGQGGYAVLFRYGVVVLFGLNDLETQKFLSDIQDYTSSPYETPSYERMKIDVNKDSAEMPLAHSFSIKHWDLERLQLIAEVLAKAAVLEHYEQAISEIFDRIEPMTFELQAGRLKKKWSKALLKHIGLVLSIERKMIAHVEIQGKPELLWEHPDLEPLHIRLEDEFEVPERHKAISQKLNLIHRTADTMFSVLQDRNTYHVEWYITILIVIEIVMGVYENFFH
tara:strand:- start:191166 stop:191963 length:798 start_codon:yes stop_codon:yes gene_type:complete